jgi:hypothetical protein
VPIGYQVTASVMFFVIIPNDRIRRAQRGSSVMRLEGEARARVDAVLACRRADRLWAPMPLLRADGGDGLSVDLYRAVAANLAFLMLALAKWYREMRDYDRAGPRVG